MTDVHDHEAGLARGRRLLRAARSFFIAAVLCLPLGGVALFVADQVGWLSPASDDDAIAAIGWFGAMVIGMVVSFGFGVAGKRLVTRHIEAVAGDLRQRGPDSLRIGTVWPRFQVGFVLTLAAVGLVALPIFRPRGVTWIVAEIAAALTLVQYVRNGPSALSVTCAYLDNTGIRLPLHGVHAPWTSIDDVRVSRAFHVAITIIGPVSPISDRPSRWTDKVVATCANRLELRIPARQPEQVIWLARRYHPVDSAPAAQASGPDPYPDHER